MEQTPKQSNGHISGQSSIIHDMDAQSGTRVQDPDPSAFYILNHFKVGGIQAVKGSLTGIPVRGCIISVRIVQQKR